MKKYTVALTGGIGSGKTTISNMFFNLGVDIIDTDIISKKIISVNHSLLKKIFEKFGKKIINSDGTLNRMNLRKIIFSSDVKRKWLNRLLHPVIYEQIFNEIKISKSLWCLCVIPLLIETKMQAIADRILVVDIPVKLQIIRAAKRDHVKYNEILSIVKKQINKKKRLSHANDIIYNIGSIEILQSMVNFLNQYYNFLSTHK